MGPISSARFQPYLEPGETVLWAGLPQQGLLFRPADLFLVPFSLLWAGFVVYWNWSVWQGGAEFFFKLIGLPFLLLGAYSVVGRFLVDKWRRRQTGYAITSIRALIHTAGLSGALRAIDLIGAPEIIFHERKAGRGTIRFGPADPREIFDEFNLLKIYGMGPMAFENIPDAAAVYALIRKVQRGASG